MLKHGIGLEKIDRQGRLLLDEMVTRRGRLDEINEAFLAMKGGRSRSNRFDVQIDIALAGARAPRIVLDMRSGAVQRGRPDAQQATARWLTDA